MSNTIDAWDLKKKYLDFFQTKSHKIIPSASLIPENDPTVLFTTAGMHPLVPYLLGQPHPLGKRLADIQKCLRTVDFENIGDNTHHTFFQMLGNWSLGDYFKKESIAWSFEFLTDKKWLNLPLNKLAFTVYEGDKKNNVPRDEESAKLWLELGAPKDRVAYLGKDNFWSAGDTGPCGPSSEIFYWNSQAPAPAKFDPKDNTWVEIWNNVFMSYNKKADGSLEQLKQKNVDTGMGYERTLAVLSEKSSSYETGLFQPIINELERISHKKYDTDNTKETDKATKRNMRIIADHLRAAVFLLGEQNGIVPSNVDRGYILRRLIRKAIRLGRLIGIGGCFTTTIAQIIITNYRAHYPELHQNSSKILSELDKEEHKFNATLENGLKEFESMAAKSKELNKKNITAKEAFLLFQSYGFPLEMTEELAAENGLTVDSIGFKKEFAQHQELSRAGSEQKFKGGLADSSIETTKLHTATHLLNEALRKVLSPEIRQRGSNITPERLRFDFNFDRKLTPEEIKAVENEVNRVIQLSLSVKREEMELSKALSVGAQGEFGVKYPEIVSVYSVGTYSKEICGGPHVQNSKEVGKFKILKEESSSAGIRRIKAVVE
ncbi:alanine--tRNA ligase [Candidatus Woesearchaeota archaeon]|nr:alanine--tRNA ligase [Candidatus Woesearchaeota archaeon]